MEASPVDPRDEVQREELPPYRVYFWLQPEDGWGAHSWEWRIVGAKDVFEVIAWAEEEHGERTYELYVEEPLFGHAESRGVRLVRLAGESPVRSGPATVLKFTRDE